MAAQQDSVAVAMSIEGLDRLPPRGLKAHALRADARSDSGMVCRSGRRVAPFQVRGGGAADGKHADDDQAWDFGRRPRARGDPHAVLKAGVAAGVIAVVTDEQNAER